MLLSKNPTFNKTHGLSKVEQQSMPANLLIRERVSVRPPPFRVPSSDKARPLEARGSNGRKATRLFDVDADMQDVVGSPARDKGCDESYPKVGLNASFARRRENSSGTLVLLAEMHTEKWSPSSKTSNSVVRFAVKRDRKS